MIILFQLQFYFYIENGICPDKRFQSFVGRCDCSDAPGWTGTGGWTVECDPCFGIQESGSCIGEVDGEPLGDGTYCLNEKRHTNCKVVNTRG